MLFILLIAILVLLFFSIKKDFYILIFIIVYHFLFSGLNLSYKLLPDIYSRLFEILIIIFLFKVIIQRTLIERLSIKIDNLSKLFLIIVFIAVVRSYFTNDLIIAFLSSKNLFALFLLYWALLNSNITPNENQYAINLFIILSIIQVFVSFVQFIVSGFAGDLNAGTFGPSQTNQLSLFQTLIIIYLFVKWYEEQTLSFVKYLILIFLSTTIFWGSSLASMVLIPSFLIISLLYVKKRLALLMVVPILVGVISIIFLIGINIFDDNRVRNFQDLEYLQAYSSGIIEGGIVGRLDIPYYTFQELNRGNNILFGYGLGVTFKGGDILEIKNSQVAFKYLGRSGLSTIVIEQGLIGLLLYILSYYLIYKKKYKSTDGNAYIKIAALYLLVVNTIYSGIWWTGYANFAFVIFIFYFDRKVDR